MYKEFILILVLSFFYCIYPMADTLEEFDDEDLKMHEGIYATTNQIKVYDPYEKVNRSIYKFNKIIDKFIILPPVKIYSTVVPHPVKKGVYSFVSNLKEPLNTLYGILQLKPKAAFDSFFRFFMNTTFGILGIFDIAREANLKKQDISFSNVLQYYGAKEGPYLMLPLLGPSTVRDGFGTAIDIISDPVNVAQFKNKKRYKKHYYIGKVIVMREQMLDNEKTLSEISLDEYVALRSFYYQRLNKSSNKRP